MLGGSRGLAVLVLGMTICLPAAAARESGLQLLYGDEESVSIATGSAKPIHLAPSAANVITADQLRDMGAQTLDQALEMVPGLHVSLSFNRNNSIYSIRGIHTGNNPQVLMLMNGMPISQLATGGRPNTFRLPVEDIARIEVIRGPGSAIYGADAFAGVINIITKTADELDGTTVGLRGGSFNSGQAWVQNGSTLGDWKLAVSFEWMKSDGDKSRIVRHDLQSTLDASAGTHASLAPGPLNSRYDILNSNLSLSNDHWRLRLWSWLQDHGGTGPGAAQALDPTGYTNEDVYLFDVGYHNADISPDWDLNARTSYLYRRDPAYFTLLPPGTKVPIGSDGNINLTSPAGTVTFTDGMLGNPGETDQVTSLDLWALYLGVQGHRLRVGTGASLQSAETFESKNFGPGVINGLTSPIDGTLTNVTNTPYVYMKDQERTVWYLSLQDEWRFAPDWELTAGVRYDDYSDFGGTTNPRLALAWSTTERLTTKLLYGRAFRAPSFSELHYINNPSLLGNPNLQPETIDTTELLFDYHGYTWTSTLDLFGYRILDLIDTVPDPGGTTLTARNARKQRGYGAEFSTRWKPTPRFTFSASYAWQRSEDTATGRQVADAPARQLDLSATWEFLPQWLVSSQAWWISGRKRAAGDGRRAIADYTWVNLNLQRRRILRHVDLGLEVHNLFDRRAYEPSNGQIPGDYPLEERSVYAKMKISF